MKFQVNIEVDETQGLDEAAKIGGEKEYPIIPELTNDGKDLHAHKQVAFRKGFIAGAKWAMEQGVTCEFEHFVETLKTLDKHGFKKGDKVIVQIRKKDE